MKKTLLVALGGLVLAGAAQAAMAGDGYLREVDYVAGQPMPEGAGPGEAWCLFQYPAVTETIYDEVVVREVMTLVKPIPPVFGKETKEYDCEPAYQVGQVIAPQFQQRNETYEYQPAYKVKKIVPATWKEVAQQVVVCEAYTEEYWESTQFTSKEVPFTICPERNELQQVQCVDGTNMDCYVTVRIPAQIQKVMIKDVSVKGQVKSREVAAKMGTITKRVIDREEQVVEEVVPAVARTYAVGFKVANTGSVKVIDVPAKKFTVTSVKVLQEASTKTETLPAVKQKVAKTVIKEPARIVWRLQRVNVQVPVQQVQVDQVRVAEQVVEEFGSIPGAVTPNFRRSAR